MKREGLVIESGYVDEGRAIKRWQPRAFGRANPIRKRSSHITLVLSGMIDANALSEKKTAKVKEEKIEETKEEKITTKAN